MEITILCKCKIAAHRLGLSMPYCTDFGLWQSKGLVIPDATRGAVYKDYTNTRVFVQDFEWFEELNLVEMNSVRTKALKLRLSIPVTDDSLKKLESASMGLACLAWGTIHVYTRTRIVLPRPSLRRVRSKKKSTSSP